jgi:hypothetical protein
MVFSRGSILWGLIPVTISFGTKPEGSSVKIFSPNR